VSQVFFSHFINSALWDRAGWWATLFGNSGDASPPVLGIAFHNEVAGRQIFQEFRDRVGRRDVYEEIRVSIVEGEIPNVEPGYAVIIGSEPRNTLARLEAEGRGLGFDPETDTEMANMRIHHMPAPQSSNLANFKKWFSAVGRYHLLPVFGTLSRPELALDLAIQKKEIRLCTFEDLADDDFDAETLRETYSLS
jgi:hypothetical protein